MFESPHDSCQLVCFTDKPNKFNFSVNTTSLSQPAIVSKDQTIRCYANGSPLPTVQWIPVTAGLSPPAPSSYKGYADMMVQDAVADQQWKCSASNSQGNATSGTVYLKGLSQYLSFLLILGVTFDSAITLVIPHFVISLLLLVVVLVVVAFLSASHALYNYNRPIFTD